MAYNLHLQLKQENCKSTSVKLNAAQLGLSETTVWNIIKEINTIGIPSSPPKKCLHETINELPTCTKLLNVISADDNLPQLKRTTLLWRI
ncbi:hypothetical protein Trydic_g19975 [Trypoxylus dichotomus]